MIYDDTFDDVASGGFFVYRMVVFVAHGFAATTTFLFGYRFLRLFGFDQVIGGLSLDGLASGVVCVLLIDLCMLAYNHMQTKTADTPLQMRIASIVYWSLLALTVVMSGIYLATVISGYAGTPNADAIAYGQWLITVIAGFDLVMTAIFVRSGSAFLATLQRAKHNAAMVRALQTETAKIQRDGRDKARDGLQRRGGALSDGLANDAVNGHIGRIRPMPARLRQASPTPQDEPRETF
jgi:hypothetical protein